MPMKNSIQMKTSIRMLSMQMKKSKRMKSSQTEKSVK